MTTQRTIDDWRQLFEQLRSSGLSIQHFCKANKLSTSNFYKWRRKLDAHEQAHIHAKNTNSGDLSTDQWQSIELPQTEPVNKPHWDIELQLPTGVTLKMRCC